MMLVFVGRMKAEVYRAGHKCLLARKEEFNNIEENLNKIRKGVILLYIEEGNEKKLHKTEREK